MVIRVRLCVSECKKMLSIIADGARVIVCVCVCARVFTSVCACVRVYMCMLTLTRACVCAYVWCVCVRMCVFACV